MFLAIILTEAPEVAGENGLKSVCWVISISVFRLFLVCMIHENIQKKDAFSNESESVLTGENKNASVVLSLNENRIL